MLLLPARKHAVNYDKYCQIVIRFLLFFLAVAHARVPTAKYTKMGETLRHVIPGHMQCSMACGGRACKYENPSRWSDEEQAVKGLYSSWYIGHSEHQLLSSVHLFFFWCAGVARVSRHSNRTSKNILSELVPLLVVLSCGLFFLGKS